MAASLSRSPQNDASRAARLLYGALPHRDWESFDSLLAEEFRADDRRKLIGGVSGNRRDFVSTWRTIADQGYETVEVTDIATRGDTLALQHFLARGTHDFTAEALAVTETDPDRITFVAVFDPDAWDVAFAELDDRFVAHEGAPYADAIRVAATMLSAYNARDWERFTSVLAPDFALVDHIPAAVGPLSSREAYVSYVRMMTELAPDVRMRIVRDHALSKGVSVSEARLNGTSVEGAEIEIAWLDVAVVRDGILRRLEQYPTDELPAALTRFNELTVA